MPVAPMVLFLGVAVAQAGSPAEPGWRDLSHFLSGEDWRTPTGEWFEAGGAVLRPGEPKQLDGKPGKGVLINDPTRRTANLVSRDEFADVDFHCEFLVPRGSNSGVKFEGLYEVQIHDSHGIEPPKAQHCGGIYPRAELLPSYHYLDDGYPPRVNAAKPAGEWQSLDVTFRAPRFDSAGKKVANARMVRVALNGQVIHENLELKTPTGHAWVRPEVPNGPLLLQADHGPVAFRNVRVRPIEQP